jgi:hypothetical protein
MPRVSLRGGRFPVVAGRNERGNVSRSVRFGLPPLTTGPLLNPGFEVILGSSLVSPSQLEEGWIAKRNHKSRFA